MWGNYVILFTQLNCIHMVWGIIIVLIITTFISLIWVCGIDHMKDKHPEYKGEDFLHWDDNKAHTEDGFH